MHCDFVRYDNILILRIFHQLFYVVFGISDIIITLTSLRLWSLTKITACIATHYAHNSLLHDDIVSSNANFRVLLEAIYLLNLT